MIEQNESVSALSYKEVTFCKDTPLLSDTSRKTESSCSQNRPESMKLWQAMRHIIPGGVNSPVRSCLSLGVHPVIVQKGHGAFIWDIDGNKYVDFCMSWGALLHGHAHPYIIQAAKAAMEEGSSFGITCVHEEKLARKIVETVPNLDMIRFVSSGTEATMSAARLARAYTKKNSIIKFQGHYHGHADQFLLHAGSGVQTLAHSSSAGVPNEFVAHTKTLPFNDPDALHEFFSHLYHANEVAALIIEPVAANMGVVPMQPDFLDALLFYRKKHAFLLIFDEVITGFRLGLHGAQSLYSVCPDLICFGKIIGGGFPAAAFGGHRKIMSLLAPCGNVYQAGTLSGNPVAMAAGYASLQLAQQKTDFYQLLRENAELFLAPIQKIIKLHQIPACIQSVGSMWTLFFGTTQVKTSSDIAHLDNDAFRCFFSYMLARGFYIPPLHNEAWFLSSAHSKEDIIRAKEVVVEFLLCYKDKKHI